MDVILNYVNNPSVANCLYILFVVLGLIFKCEHQEFAMLNSSEKIRRISSEIFFIAIISYFFDNIKKIEQASTSASTFVILILVGYCIYVLNNKFNENDRFFYSFINGYLITALSFLGLPVNIFISIVLIAISALISFKLTWIEKSEFCEVVLLCVESVAITIIVKNHNLHHFVDTVLIVLFTETGMTFINCIFMYCFKSIFNETPSEYLYKAKGHK